VKQRLLRHRVDVLLVLSALVVCGPIVTDNSAQPSVRLGLTAAIAEHGTVDVTGYHHGVDYAVYNGHLRMDKAPGQPIMTVPLYLIERAVGAQSADHLRYGGDLTLWWIVFWSAGVPFALLLVLMRRLAARVVPRGALAATLMLGFGTMILPFSASLFGHVLAADLLLLAWMALQRHELDTRALVLAGLCCGFAVFVEYETFCAVVVLAGYVVWRERARVGWLMLGGVPGALALGAYNTIAFGAPWHISYSYYIGQLNGTTQVNWSVPGPHAFTGFLFGDRGLLLVSPIVLVALVFACAQLRDPNGRLRAHAAVAVGVSAVYALMVIGYNGDVAPELPGPRWLIPAIPFLVVPLAAGWERVRAMPLPRVLVAGAAVWGFLLMGAALLTGPAVGQHEPLIQAYGKRVEHLHFVQSVWYVMLGRAGVVVYLATIAAVVLLAFRLSSERSADSEQVFAEGVATR